MEQPKTTFLTRDKQNIYDLSLQLLGDISKIGILMELFPNLNYDIPLNSPVTLETQKDPIAKFFLDRGVIVSTDFYSSIAEDFRITDLGFRIINTGEFRTVS